MRACKHRLQWVRQAVYRKRICTLHNFTMLIITLMTVWCSNIQLKGTSADCGRCFALWISGIFTQLSCQTSAPYESGCWSLPEGECMWANAQVPIKQPTYFTSLESSRGCRAILGAYRRWALGPSIRRVIIFVSHPHFQGLPCLWEEQTFRPRRFEQSRGTDRIYC